MDGFELEDIAEVDAPRAARVARNLSKESGAKLKP